ncbi:hypothetical protein AC630_15305 [Bradyrhizobium sp. AS23.2]|nr:hypothetical protein AC630_15305 [Bradyrhizobium sp. AS23.2]
MAHCATFACANAEHAGFDLRYAEIDETNQRRPPPKKTFDRPLHALRFHMDKIDRDVSKKRLDFLIFSLRGN